MDQQLPSWKSSCYVQETELERADLNIDNLFLAIDYAIRIPVI